MEALLHHLIDYGIEELSFIIVNSRDQLSRSVIHRLESSVSFPVYQETDEERVWKVLEGGKDDMFVYDKCGRLTYYIPFPLSIIHEDQPIVQAALLSTYFQSPCGTDCSQNSTFAINALDEEIPEEAIKHSNSTNEHVNVEDDFADLSVINSTFSLEESSTTKPDVDYYDLFENFTMNENATDEIFNIYNGSFTEVESTKNDSSLIEPVQVRPKKQGRGVLSSLLNYVMGISQDSAEDMDKDDDLGGTSAITNNSLPNYNEQVNKNDEETTENPNLNPCVAIDENVCKDYSKRRLLQAQKCCAFLTDHAKATGNHQQSRSCKNYGKKRCTKMLPLFKCCLKTKIEKTDEAGVDDEQSTNVESS